MSTGVYLLGTYSLEEAMVRSLQYAASAPAGSATAQGLPDREALRATEWMTTVYDDYALYDLDQDTRTELAVVRVDKAGTNSAVDLYGWRDGSFMVRGLHAAVHGNLQCGEERRGDQFPQGGRRCSGPGAVRFK